MSEENKRYLIDKLEYPNEVRDTEYKSAVTFDEKTDFASKLTKQIIGFANSGGGYIIIGFRENTNRTLEPDPAMTPEVASSYEVTRLSQYVERYLSGQDRIKIEIPKIVFKGFTFPIISIGRFPEYPFICTKDCKSIVDGQFILQADQLYIRIDGARTMPVKSPSEWRQLLREYIKATPNSEIIPIKRTEDDSHLRLFLAWTKQEKDVATKELVAVGLKGGFFGFIIQAPQRAVSFENNRLLEAARRSECHNTGWPIGVVLQKPENRPVSLNDGIRTMVKSNFFSKDTIEFDYWALNNRGHFLFIRSMEEDIEFKRELNPGQKVLAFDVVIWRISEIFLYTSLLSLK